MNNHSYLLGYAGVYKSRTGEKVDGCAIIYKKAMFTCEKEIPVEYLNTKIPVLDRDNIGLIVLLQPMNSNKKICVANTHLLFNPKRGDVKLAQLLVLLSEIDKAAFICSDVNNRPYYHPSFICGDLNLEPYSDIHGFLSQGSLTYNGLNVHSMSGQLRVSRASTFMSTQLVPSDSGMTPNCQYVEEVKKRQEVEQEVKQKHQGTVSHDLQLQSVYEHKNGSSIEVTTNHLTTSCTVDYMFYSNTGKTRNCNTREKNKEDKHAEVKLIKSLKLFDKQQMQELGGLPNEIISSDHTILMAVFRLLNT